MGSPPLALRKSGDFMAVSSAPSINKTPLGKATPAVGYQVSADLSNSVGVAPNVWFNDQPAVIFDQSTQPRCTGDEAGSAGGIHSGTCGGEVKPTSCSSSVWICGKPAMRIGDTCTLNNGNCPGVYVSVPPPEGTAPGRSASILTSLMKKQGKEVSWTYIPNSLANSISKRSDISRMA